MQEHVVAACQLNCGADARPRDNAEKIRSCIAEAAERGARLALFPEACLSGYTTQPQDIARRARQTPDLLESVRDCVRAASVAAVVGIFEPTGDGGFYNTAVAIAPDGGETRYRKLHLPPNEPAITPGSTGPAVADLGFVRLGMSICYDNWIAESARMAYLAGAEMLHMPFYWPAEWEVQDDLPAKRTARDDAAILKARRERMMKVFPARALDNGMYLVMVDNVCRSEDIGRHLPGKSMVFDPYGEVVVESTGWVEQTLYFTFQPQRVRQWRSCRFFPPSHLRPDVYQSYYAAQGVRAPS